MRNPFTLQRWRDRQWQLFLVGFIAWASIWQIVEASDSARIAVATANLIGTLTMFIALHLRIKELSRAIERWASVMIIWSLSCYLALALSYEGWWGLVHQTNLGVVSAEAIICACVQRIIYTKVFQIRRDRKIKAEAEQLIRETQED